MLDFICMDVWRDYVRTNTYMRNHINGKPSHRIEIDHERTLYPTRASRRD